MDNRPDKHTINQRKVVYIDKYVSPHQMAEKRPVNKTNQRPFHHKAIIIGLGLLTIALACLPLIQTVGESKAVHQQYTATQELEEEAKVENLMSQEEYQHMQDPDYLAEVARRDYLYSKPGEIVFDIKE